MGILFSESLADPVPAKKAAGEERIEFAFTRARLNGLVGAALLTASGLVATGVLAGIEMGRSQNPPATVKAAPIALPLSPKAPAVAPVPVLQPQAPQPEAAQPEAAQPEAPQPEAPQYVVQMGSFLAREEAGKLIAALVSRHFPAELSDWQDRKGRTWTVVLAGPYAGRPDALRASAELAGLFATTPIVRPK